MWCFLFFGLLAAGFCAGQDGWEKYNLEKQGITTQGKAFRIDQIGLKAGTAYAVRYVFLYNHKAYVSEQNVDRAWAKASQMPMLIRVQFSAGNPDLNWAPEVAKDDVFREALGLFVFVLLAAMAAGVKAWFELRDYLRQRREARRFDIRGLHLPAHPKGWH